MAGEIDVLDTWMDSSITAAVHAGWPENEDQFKRLFPADLQPNGLDIIRTWDYYLLVRSLALFGIAPYKTLLINGMVRGTDGRMMHKSYGNYVESEDALKRYGADAFRQWVAAGGSTGYDIPFQWAEVEHGKKFLTKLWNVARFILANAPTTTELPPCELTLLDKWILGSIQRLVSEVTEAFENYQFNTALEATRNFTWHSLADDYIEAVKHRLQPEAPPTSGNAAQYCLRTALLTICKLLAPLCPHITESIYQQIPKKEQSKSIHVSLWPAVDSGLIKDEWIRDGNTLSATIAYARRIKAEKGMALKAPIKKLVISASKESLEVLQRNREDILNTLKAEMLVLEQLPKDNGTLPREGIRVDIVA